MSSIATITILLLVLQFSNVYAFHLNNVLRVPTSRKASIFLGTFVTKSSECKYQPIRRHHDVVSCLNYSEGNNEEEEEGDDDVIAKEEEDEEDWRTFRARLVSGEAQTTHRQLPVLFHGECDLEEGPGCDDDDDETNTKNTSFLYESGSVIEQGTLILHRPPTPTATVPFFLSSLKSRLTILAYFTF
jgi:hypothetical protein